MPFKDVEKRRKYRREWYANHRESERNHIKRRRKEIKTWFRGYKKSLKCSKCLESHPATLEFHHKSKKQKENQIAIMVNNGFSIKTIQGEISKCQVLCANCHRKVHYKVY